MPKIMDWWGNEVKDPKHQELFTYRCIGKGWHPLLKLILENVPEDTEILQVKEKVGQLRVYTNPYHPLEEFVLCQSQKICERCGDPGRPRVLRSWIYTVCDTCEQNIKDSWE